MAFFKRTNRKRLIAITDRRCGNERRRPSGRRGAGGEWRIRRGFRVAYAQNASHAQQLRVTARTKIGSLAGLMNSVAAEAAKYTYFSRGGCPVSWRAALEHSSHLAWDLHQQRMATETNTYPTTDVAADIVESTVDYLLARYRVSQGDRRVKAERRASS